MHLSICARQLCYFKCRAPTARAADAYAMAPRGPRALVCTVRLGSPEGLHTTAGVMTACSTLPTHPEATEYDAAQSSNVNQV